MSSATSYWRSVLLRPRPRDWRLFLFHRQLETDVGAGADAHQGQHRRAELGHGQIREHRGEEDPAEDEGPDHDLQSVERDDAVIVGNEIAHESSAGARTASRRRRDGDSGERRSGADPDQAEKRRRDRDGFAGDEPDENVADYEQ